MFELYEDISKEYVASGEESFVEGVQFKTTANKNP
jgi:hypothetical protein